MIESSSFELGRRRFLKIIAIGFATLCGAASAQADSSSVQERYVVGIANDVMELANSKIRGSALKARFVTLLTRNSDVRSVALFSLGQYQKNLPSDLKNDYFRLVVEYTAGLFVYYIDDFAASGLDVKSSKSSGKATIIDSNMVYPDHSTSPVRWRVVNNGGGYRVSDVNVRGIWLSLQMREKFTDILRQNKGDFNALLSYLRSNA